PRTGTPAAGSSLICGRCCRIQSRLRNAQAGSGGLLLVLDEHSGIYSPRRYWQTLLPQELDMLLHPPSRLVQAIFDGMTDSRKPFEVGRVESEEIWILGGFDDQGVAE